MHFSTLAAAATLGLIQAAYAHTTMNQIWINDASQGLGTCIRPVKDRYKANYPIGPGSGDLACGVDGETPVPFTCPAKAGDKLTFGFNFGKHNGQDGHLATSHKGPCSIMAKKVDSATKSKGSGDGWFRIFYEGYDKATGKWCTERMMGNGMLSITIPGDLAPGDYLFRSELLALHAAANGDPQFYVSCAQVFLASGGSARPGNTVSIPGYVQPGSPAMNFNYYYPTNAAESYPNYGPPSYQAAGSGGSQTLTQTDGLKPKDCILQVENWCGGEVPSYSDSNSCWASHKKCYEIADTCWKSAIVDNSNCQLYANKCDAMKKSCESGGSGPPNAGKVLTPNPGTASCPAPLNGAGGAPSYSANNDVAGSGFDVKGKNVAAPSSDAYASASPSSSYAAASDSPSSSPATQVSPETTSAPSSSSSSSGPAAGGYASPTPSPSTAVSPENTSAPAAASSSSSPSSSYPASSPSTTAAPVPTTTSGCPPAVTVTKTVTETVSATVDANNATTTTTSPSASASPSSSGYRPARPSKTPKVRGYRLRRRQV